MVCLKQIKLPKTIHFSERTDDAVCIIFPCELNFCDGCHLTNENSFVFRRGYHYG